MSGGKAVCGQKKKNTRVSLSKTYALVSLLRSESKIQRTRMRFYVIFFFSYNIVIEK